MQDRHWILECKSYARDRKAGTSHDWDETLQPTSPLNQWEQMDRFWQTQNHHRRDNSIFRKRSPAPQGTSHHPQERSRGVPAGGEANQKQAHKSEIQRETHQHNYHPVLHTNKRQWVRQRGHLHEELESELENTPRRAMNILMGDLEANVGNDNRNYERAMGREACGTMKDNGERLLDI